MKKRKICVINESRSEYGILFPLMKSIEKDSKLELSIIVTNMHLLHKFGYTVNEIEEDGFVIAKKIPSLSEKDDDIGSMITAFSKELTGFKKALLDISPDIVFVCGDRSPALAAAIVASHLGIPVFHHSGGDVSGAVVDEPIRHALTRFAHVHLPMTKESAKRLERMGEEPERIHIVGPLGVDVMKEDMFIESESMAKEFKLDLSKPLILMVQHPLTFFSTKVNLFQVRETLEVIKELGEQTIIVYPNSDAGGREMINVIKEYENNDFIRSYKNIYFRKYLSLMRLATVMIGNSSSGLSETPYFNLPTIDIGNRQDGRERGSNVVHVNPKKSEIKDELTKILYDEKYRSKLKNCNNPFRTKGNPIRIILDIIKNISIDNKLLVKKLTY